MAKCMTDGELISFVNNAIGKEAFKTIDGLDTEDYNRLRDLLRTGVDLHCDGYLGFFTDPGEMHDYFEK